MQIAYQKLSFYPFFAWFVMLNEYKLQAFENEVLQQIFMPKLLQNLVA